MSSWCPFLDLEPNHPPLKYRCPIKSSNSLRPAYFNLSLQLLLLFVLFIRTTSVVLICLVYHEHSNKVEVLLGVKTWPCFMRAHVQPLILTVTYIACTGNWFCDSLPMLHYLGKSLLDETVRFVQGFLELTGLWFLAGWFCLRIFAVISVRMQSKPCYRLLLSSSPYQLRCALVPPPF